MSSKDIVGTDYLKVNKDYRINVSKILPDDVKRDLTYPMVVNVAMSKTWKKHRMKKLVKYVRIVVML